MINEILMIGYGPVGRATVQLLRARGTPVRVAQRSRPADLPDGVAFTPCDILDPASVAAAVQGASQIAVAVGFDYTGPAWESAWPVAMRNLLDACAAEKVRMLFFDNLYM